MQLGHRIVMLGATAILLVTGISGAALLAAARGDRVRSDAFGDRRQLEAVYEMAVAVREMRRAHRTGNDADAAAAEARIRDQLHLYRTMHVREVDAAAAREQLALADTLEAAVEAASHSEPGAPVDSEEIRVLIDRIDAALRHEREELHQSAADAEELIAGVRIVGIVVPVVAVIVIVALAAGLLLPLRRRVRDLLVGAERFARGDGAEIPEAGSDELARVARAWNAMHRELRKTTVSRAELEQNLAELREARAQLVVADRMALVGTLAAGVAHEINNPLAYLTANVEWVRTRLQRAGGHEPLAAALTEAEDGAARIASIVGDLRAFSRDDETRAEVDLAQVVDDAIRLAGHEVRQLAEIERQLGEVPSVFGNRMRLGQVVLNLVVNASQAFSGAEGAAPRIVVRTRKGEDGGAIVEVEDNGAGVAEEIRHRIFDPFFSTKPVGVGTGLGLSVCNGIVAAHGGTLAHEHRPGGGSVFRVTLPSAACARAA